jgi:hypothetical protein
VKSGIIAANRRRHGTASVVTPVSDDVTAYRGALTLASAAGVNMGALVATPFNATASTYTLTSGTSGHWTTPTDGTFPTPNGTGAAAFLNGGPYVFSYTCTDGLRSASGTLTINIRANTYTASTSVQLASIKALGAFDGKTVEFAKGSTGFASATDASPINFDWRAATSCTITHEDTSVPCTVGNIKLSGANNLTFSHIVVTPNDRLTASALQKAWYILSNATGSTTVTLNACGVNGPADPLKTVYGVYIDARNQAVTLTTQDLTLKWVQYGIFPLYNDASFAYTANHNGQTTVRYFTADANRYGAISGTGNQTIYYENLVVMSPMYDRTNPNIHCDGLQQNQSSIVATGAVTLDRYTFILADGNECATDGVLTSSATGGPTIRNFIYIGRALHAMSFYITDSTHMPRVGNATALLQWSGIYGSDVPANTYGTGLPSTELNYRPDGNLNPTVVLASTVASDGAIIKDTFVYGNFANSSPYVLPASVTNNASNADVSATLPNASWITSTTLRNTALLPANDVDNYTGLADSRWTADTDSVLASVIAALTPASGTVGAVSSDGSRPLATFP